MNCRKCKRLVHYREHVPAKKIHEHETYWRRPVPGFGDEKGWLLIAGLAPAPHGGNRTGRVFTGDDSGRFLFKMLHKEGFANQALSEAQGDGLKLHGCYVTAAVKCTPPHHKPSPQELSNCNGYFINEMHLLKNLKAVLALGKFAFDAFLFSARQLGHSTKGIRFHYGTKVEIDGLPVLYACYHPSPRNTNTGTLTEAMFCKLLRQIRKDITS